jgi:hypothetical protein
VSPDDIVRGTMKSMRKRQKMVLVHATAKNSPALPPRPTQRPIYKPRATTARNVPSPTANNFLRFAMAELEDGLDFMSSMSPISFFMVGDDLWPKRLCVDVRFLMMGIDFYGPLRHVKLLQRGERDIVVWSMQSLSLVTFSSSSPTDAHLSSLECLARAEEKALITRVLGTGRGEKK